MSKVVLITGCSSGIGNDLARRLALSGYSVVATARRVETLVNLPCTLKLQLDVTRPESIHQAIACILQRFGRIDVLVNNAGYAVCGVVEEVPVEQAQWMFDVNLFGVIRMIQAVIPHMRRQKSGHIINISSVAGKLVLPVNGTYSATKSALETLSEALRLELEPFGIRVSLIEPGAIKTNFDQTVKTQARQVFCNPESPYRLLYRQYQRVSDSMRLQEQGPEVVSRVIQQAIESGQPKARYLAGFPFSGRMVLRMGDTVWKFVLKQMFKRTPAVV